MDRPSSKTSIVEVSKGHCGIKHFFRRFLNNLGESEEINTTKLENSINSALQFEFSSSLVGQSLQGEMMESFGSRQTSRDPERSSIYLSSNIFPADKQVQYRSSHFKHVKDCVSHVTFKDAKMSTSTDSFSHSTRNNIHEDLSSFSGKSNFFMSREYMRKFNIHRDEDNKKCYVVR